MPMALVSSSVPIQLRQPPGVHGFSRVPSGAPPATAPADAEEEAQRVFVAVGKEYKESKATLIWALRNVPRDKKLVLVHVHRPAQMIPMMGAKFPVNQLTEEQVRGFRQLEKQKMNKTLDEYLALCTHAKVQAGKLVIEMDDIGKGLVELIDEYRIRELVLGAAADKQYSKKMKAPKSKTAFYVQKHADQECKIWLVCKGNLICTRERASDGSMVQRSPIANLDSYQLCSRSLPRLQTMTPEFLTTPTRRSISEKYDSQRGNTMPSLSFELPISITSTQSFSSGDETLTDPWEGDSRSSPTSDHSTLSIGDKVFSKEEAQKSPSLEREDIEIDNDFFEKMQHVLKEAEDSKREAFEESCKRRKAQIEAIEASRKVKAAENMYIKELKKRDGVQLELERERVELGKIKTHHDELMEELQRAKEEKVQMEIRLAASEKVILEFQDKLSVAKHLLSSIHIENKELQQGREDAIREAEELRRKREEATNNWSSMNLTEFTISEIKEAINNFDISMKIGEGGYGSVYKGFLRHTAVAIKMLDSQGTQGQSEFYQEAEILSRVRHPNLVTLIGTCPEAWAIIYEYLPEGSLEDRLTCKGNTPSLPWHVRTRIAAEICSALVFLHSFKPHPVVHGDLKPANILLDSNFVSKIGDFGICRLLDNTNTTITPCKRTDPKGTFVYMDPEFFTTGELTPFSDVYSFGIIILRLLTGRPALGIVKEVKEALDEDRLHEMLDASGGDWPFVQAKELAILALRFCELKRKKRPDLAMEAWRVFEPMMKATSYVGSPSNNRCVPSFFICPIFKEIMKDPHMAADGVTYEAEAIKGWLDSGNEKSPMTNLKLSHRDLIPNHALRAAIQEWVDKQK